MEEFEKENALGVLRDHLLQLLHDGREQHLETHKLADIALEGVLSMAKDDEELRRVFARFGLKVQREQAG